jgi:hypothetical protein
MCGRIIIIIIIRIIIIVKKKRRIAIHHPTTVGVFLSSNFMKHRRNIHRSVWKLLAC